MSNLVSLHYRLVRQVFMNHKLINFDSEFSKRTFTYVAVNAESFQVEKSRIQSEQNHGSVTQNATQNNNVVELW